MAKKKLVVIGGGAAGFFCAVNAARMNPHLEVVIIERSSKLLAKVKISGGGRCNVTHACYSITDMVKKYPRGSAFLKKAFHHFFTTDTIAWFSERGVQLKTEPDNRMFPESNTSQTIIDCLLQEANKYAVKILMNTEVKEIPDTGSRIRDIEFENDRQQNNTAHKRFTLLLKNDSIQYADFICIACGGFAKASQFEWLLKTGHSTEKPVPSLFTFNMPGNNITGLMGISVENVIIKIAGTKLQQSGPVLITHWGLSGPAVLKLSAWGAKELAASNYEFKISVNWLHSFNENNLRDKIHEVRFDVASQKIYNRNPFGLPARLWEYILQLCGIPEEMRWADLPAREQNKLIKTLCAQEFYIKGKTTFKEEFVTAGGISTDEVDVNTMESKIVPGLFFAGEVLNVDGITGGFNFQNAWTTGWIASKGIVRSSQVHSS